MMAYRIIILMILVGWTMAISDWTTECSKCYCLWSKGKKSADCTYRNLTEIPKNLSTEIRVIDFSNNPLYGLSQDVFFNAQLRDVHELKFQNCSIETIHRTAFSGLSLLRALDLSKNHISELDNTTFRDNLRLNELSLASNKLKRLDNGLFYNMTQLQKLYLQNNSIEYIDNEVFVLLPKLQHIDLGYNKLKTIETDFTKYLPNLISLSLEGNQWICDCHLQNFRNKTISKTLITTPTECSQPERLKGRMWSDMTIVFSCLPKIIEPQSNKQIEAKSTNVTLTCKVLGEPQPDVDWVSNGRIIDKDPRQTTQRYILSKKQIDQYTWNNLTITNLNNRDRGEYKCVAKNPGGVDEKNITLIISTYYGNNNGSGFIMGEQLPLIIGFGIGALVILLLILILICCCCKRNTNSLNAKRRNLQISDECIDLHGQPEMEKALITDVNPVMKPPRVCSVPPSVNSGGTEVSEVKKNLLDNDSIFAGDDESHSLDFEQHLYRKSQNLLEPDYRGTQMYPPDLLPFPPRISQVSPAGSSASTVADTSRLPSHHGPQSPLHSPLYDQINLYRTLPYSRSQSPFVSGVPLPRIPRQGYVTIPRRPRQSWSSEAPLMSDIGEPLYDNLGLRTTVDGSTSITSLNTVGEATSPKSIRIFPLSPTNCDPIAEHESSNAVVAASTLPRNLESMKLSPSRINWAKANAEALRSPEYAQRRNSLPSSDGKKVPPLPPPKPKKRTSTGPLFEDEGEDGTEV